MKILQLVRRAVRPRRRVLMFGPATTDLPADARRLAGNPHFRKRFAEGSEIIEARRGWSPWRELDNEKPPEGVTSAERNFVQEVLLQLSLFHALQSRGVEYEAVAGISLGDAAAAHAAGMLTFEETLEVTCETIRAVLCAGGGDLVAVQAAASVVNGVIGDAASNVIDWPVRSVWAVPDETSRQSLRKLRAAGIPYTKLAFNCLSHTDRVDAAGMTNTLAGLPTRSAAIRLYSTLEGGAVTTPATSDRWARVICGQVKLAGMWNEMQNDGFTEIAYIGSVDIENDLFAGMPLRERPTSFEHLAWSIPVSVDGAPPAAAPSRSQGIPLVLYSAEFARDPYPYYSEWLEAGPVHEVPGENAWVVLGYGAVASVLRQPDLFSSTPFREFSPSLMGTDPPEHTRNRRALAPAFSKERQVEKRDNIAALTENAIREIRRLRTFDLVRDFASPLLFSTACDWLGLVERHAYALSMMDPDDVTWPDVERALGTDGTIPRLIEAADVPQEEIAKSIRFLMIANVLTSRDLLLMAIHNLLRKRELLDEIDANRALIGPLIDEMLRCEPPVQGLVRRAMKDVELEGVAIPPGSTVWVWLAAANRDPAVFDRANEIVLGRNGPRHLSFGHGPHLCLGRHLGRLQAEVVMEKLLPELKSIRATMPPDFMFSSIEDNPPWVRTMRSWQLSYTRNASA